MNIITDYKKDLRIKKQKPGSYEWWYFDAVSRDKKYSLVMIFYDGIPFSPRYNKAVDKGDTSKAALAESHPAVSLSVYERGEPIFYSIVEYDPDSCFFSDAGLDFRIGNNHVYAQADSNQLKYKIQLDEILPSGDALKATLLFKSSTAPLDLLKEPSIEIGDKKGHYWNLIQPRAQVQGDIVIDSAKDKTSRKIDFKGNGYHDHNVGNEPMKNEFKDWYWGRVHYEFGTLVYYIMNKKNDTQHKAWLISPDNQSVISEMELVKAESPGFNPFLLSYSKKLTFKSEHHQAIVNQKQTVDSGPFYIRFNCGATLTVPNEGTQIASGISEYIQPSRIHRKIFWPLVNMRYRYASDKKAHWVQKSATLYRWTW